MALQANSTDVCRGGVLVEAPAKNPYPELAKGLLDYFMQPAHYDKIVQSTGGGWVLVYKRLFDSPKALHPHGGDGGAGELCRLADPGRRRVMNTQIIPR